MSQINNAGINNTDEEFLRLCALRALKLAKENTQMFGLLSGLSGTILGLAYLNRQSDIVSSDDIALLIEQAVEYLKRPTMDTLCDGTTGVCWMLRILSRERVVDVDNIDEVLADVDRLNAALFQREMEVGNIDFLHGAIGMAHYLLTFGIDKESVSIAVVKKLKELAEEDASGQIRWRKDTFNGGSTREPVYNLGMSHGMAAIVYLLAEIYETTKNEEALRLLKGCLRYYSAVFEKYTLSPFSFPSWIPIETAGPPKRVPGGRLAWCYGDVGVSFALFKAARVLGDEPVYAMAMKALDKTLRHDVPTNDWCFCHGAAGLHYMYKKAYLFTGAPRFGAAANLWKKRLLGMRDDILNSEFLGVLQGIPGVILSLLEENGRPIDSWDSILLLNAI